MNEINIHRGRSKTIRVPVIYKDGTACTLTGYDYIFFAVKADKDGETLIKKMLSYDSGSNKATLSLIPEDTAGLEIDRYFYDIGVCFSDGNYKDIISWGEFNVLPSAGGVDLKVALVDSLQNTSTISVNTTSKTATVTCSATGGTKPYLFTIREDISETTKYSRGETITFQLSDYSHYHFTVVVTDANNISAVVDKRGIINTPGRILE